MGWSAARKLRRSVDGLTRVVAVEVGTRRLTPEGRDPDLREALEFARTHLADGVEPPLRMANVPSVGLLHEALVDQVEVNQILAQRDAQPPLPPPPPLPVVDPPRRP